MFKANVYPIINKQNIAKNSYMYTIYCPEIAKIAQSGQFVHIKVEGFSLRRPISICKILDESIVIVFEARGDGTQKLSELKKGDMIDMIAPLGKGFTLLDKDKKAVVVGGGIGVPPMVQVASHYDDATAILGFRNSSAVILEDEFKNPIVTTDDGTYGTKGFTTDVLKDYLSNNKIDIIYGCGPEVMLSKIADMAKENGIYCELSLEQRMACGVGACLVCACKTVKNGEEYYAHVCKDGPVFKSEDIIFE